MAKRKRTIEEVDKVRQQMLDAVVELIVEDGYHDFSMRKIAKKLNISATAIYDYFDNKESLYLNVLIEGFKQLNNEILKAKNESTNIQEEFRNLAINIINFGIEKNNLYNLMLTFKVPKYKDFIGTSHENVAKQELETAMIFRQNLQDTLEECRDVVAPKDVPIYDILINFSLEIHGFISFYNSQVLDYITGDVTNKDKSILIDIFLSKLTKNS